VPTLQQIKASGDLRGLVSAHSSDISRQWVIFDTQNVLHHLGKLIATIGWRFIRVIMVDVLADHIFGIEML
jgi:hypothetical protein